MLFQGGYYGVHSGYNVINDALRLMLFNAAGWAAAGWAAAGWAAWKLLARS